MLNDGVPVRDKPCLVGVDIGSTTTKLLVLDGEGMISSRGEKYSYRKGDSIFLPAGSGDYTIEGKCDALLTTIREKADPVRVGINIGSSRIQIGRVSCRERV